MLAWIYTPFHKNDSSNNEDVKQRILLLKKLFEGLLRHKVAYVQLQCSDGLKDTNFTSPLVRLQIIITRHPVIDYCTLKMLPTLN